MSDAFHFEEWIEQALGDIAGGFAERRFGFQKLGRDFTLDHDLRVGRHQHVVGFTPHDFDRRAGEPAGNVELAHAKRNPRRRSVSDTGRRADHQRRLQRNAALLTLAPVITTMIARAQKNSGPRRAFDMAAVVADIDVAGFRIAREPVRRRGKRRAIVTRRGDWNRKLAQTAHFH